MRTPSPAHLSALSQGWEGVPGVDRLCAGDVADVNKVRSGYQGAELLLSLAPGGYVKGGALYPGFPEVLDKAESRRAP